MRVDVKHQLQDETHSHHHSHHLEIFRFSRDDTRDESRFHNHTHNNNNTMSSQETSRTRDILTGTSTGSKWDSNQGNAKRVATRDLYGTVPRSAAATGTDEEDNGPRHTAVPQQDDSKNPNNESMPDLDLHHNGRDSKSPPRHHGKRRRGFFLGRSNSTTKATKTTTTTTTTTTTSTAEDGSTTATAENSGMTSATVENRTTPPSHRNVKSHSASKKRSYSAGPVARSFDPRMKASALGEALGINQAGLGQSSLDHPDVTTTTTTTKTTTSRGKTKKSSSSQRKAQSDSHSTDETAKNLLDMIIQEKAFAVSFLHLQSIPALLLESRDVQNNLEVLHLEFTDISVIPLDLMNFMKLKSLNLSHNKIQYIPEEIVNLKDMTYLNLSANYIEEVPDLSGLDLHHLNLGGNRLTDVHNSVHDMKQLEYLNLSNNKLRELSANVGDLVNLRQLHLQDNYLTSLPSEICSLNRLTVLYVNRNRLKELPVDFHSSLKQLEEFNASRNYLTEKSMENLSSMTHLKAYLFGSNRVKEAPRGTSCFDTANVEIRMVDMSNNRMTAFPTEIRRCAKTLLHLDLRNNYIKSITSGIKYLVHLQRLDLSRNKIQVIPSYFSRLIGLRLLRISHNEIHTIHPDAFSGLKELEEVQLDHNRLEKLPPNMGDLKKLARLMLQHNSLEAIPESIGDCPLYHLDISNNKLTVLPVTLGQCITLHKIVFNDNLIEQNPNQLTRLTNLQFVNCKNNPFMKNFTQHHQMDEAREKVVAQSLSETLNDLEMEAAAMDKQLNEELAHRMQHNIDQRSLEEILELPDTQPLTCSIQ